MFVAEICAVSLEQSILCVKFLENGGGGVREVERGGACGVGSTLQCDPNFLQCRFQLLTEMAWSSRLEWERELQPEFHPYRLSRAGTLN